MKCKNCNTKIISDKQFCSKECSNDFRRTQKIINTMKKTEHILKYDVTDFVKSLINEKTNKLEPNKMKPEYFNNMYILPMYYRILDKTNDYKTLTFKEKVYTILNNTPKNKTINDLLDIIVKENGGIDFNKLNSRWLELNGFLTLSKKILKIDKKKLEEYLFLISHEKKKCLTCGAETKFKGYARGYYDFCSTTCLSNNNEIKRKKKKHKNEKKLSMLFGLETITPLFEKNEYIGSHQGLKYSFKCLRCKEKFESRIANGHIPLCPKCDYTHFNGNSNMENELISILEQEYTLEQSNRIILNGKELDVYIPSKKIAIEFNGIYWHSELNGKDNQYHLNKTKRCEEQGIQLIHIFENEWIEKRDIVLSIINAKLGKFNKRIYARQCQIKEISSKEKNEFLEQNHLQGQDKSSVKIGLFHNDELVSVMTFGKSRYNKRYQHEMHRFCNKKGYQVIGGASKLWTYFVRNHKPQSVITYADRRYSDGTFYERIGFEKIGVSTPNYFYFKKGDINILSRIKFQKHKLKDELDNFNPNLTEWENMQLNGYDRIWDCGNCVFEWKIRKNE